MTDWSNSDYARAALADPRLPDFELAAIAAAQPSLWPQVALHPAAYPDLLAWLAEQGVPIPAQNLGTAGMSTSAAPSGPQPQPGGPPSAYASQPMGQQVGPYPPSGYLGFQPSAPQQLAPQGDPQPSAGYPAGQPMGPQAGPYAPSGYPGMVGTAPQAPTAGGSRRRVVLIVAAVVLVLGGGAGAWAMTQSGGSDSWRPTNVRTVPPGTPADVGR